MVLKDIDIHNNSKKSYNLNTKTRGNVLEKLRLHLSFEENLLFHYLRKNGSGFDVR